MFCQIILNCERVKICWKNYFTKAALLLFLAAVARCNALVYVKQRGFCLFYQIQLLFFEPKATRANPLTSKLIQLNTNVVIILDPVNLFVLQIS